MNERPFKLPYRHVPPAQYQKLRVTLNEMEERGIIRKSTSEFASQHVLVWKRNGDLCICTDFRWLNAQTVAFPLLHQEDCLAALAGNALFSTMDLKSGFYNIPLHEDHKKFTAFASPVGLHEYNRLPQGQPSEFHAHDDRKLTASDWTLDCEDALQKLKDALLNNVILAHPDFSKPFILSNDVSSDVLGAVLSQVAPGDEQARPIAFASKSLTKAQGKYRAHRLEFLALK